MTHSPPPPALDQPDDTHGDKDPFVTAVQIWFSTERMRTNGFPEKELADIVQSMDELMTQHRRSLVDQYVQIPAPSRTPALRRELGLEYWGDGGLLARNDADRKAT